MQRELVLTDEDKAILGENDTVTVSLQHRRALLDALRTSGVFITCGKTTPNIMSSHWATIGLFWNRDVFILPVRRSKMSHEIIDQTKSFAVSIPIKDMREQIIQCDHLSGYNVNKFEELHLHPARARKIPTYTVSECGLFFECKVIYSANDMSPNQLDSRLKEEMYESNDFHTIYFGQIINEYEAESFDAKK